MIRRPKALSLILWLAASSLHAQQDVKLDKITIDGKEYQSVSLVPKSRLAVTLRHSEGISTVPSAKLPSDIQQQLGLVVNLELTPKLEVYRLKDNVQSIQFSGGYNQFLAEQRKSMQRITVTQDLGDVIIGKLDSGELVAILGDNQSRTDGEVIEGLLAELPKNYTYTTVLGAQATLKAYSIRPPLGMDDFIQMLKDGGSITIISGTVRVACPSCGGKPTECRNCASEGSVLVDQPVLLKW